jgi:GR25 family glycosyltransferase involved in LPS biosynthesis
MSRESIFINIIVVIIIIISCIVIYNKNNKYDLNYDWSNKIDGIVYINLEKREDRKKLILHEFNIINTDMKKVNKVSGIYTPKNGHKGCVQSHILALQIAIMNNWNNVLIFEDDMMINVNPSIFNDMINNSMDYLKDKKWDVLMLATMFSKKNKLSDNNNLSKVTKATTGSGYIVNSKYYKTLLDLYTVSNNNMSKDKWSRNINNEPYALDQMWLPLQEKDDWFAFNTDLIKQRNIKSTTMSERF